MGAEEHEVRRYEFSLNFAQFSEQFIGSLEAVWLFPVKLIINEVDEDGNRFPMKSMAMFSSWP